MMNRHLSTAYVNGYRTAQNYVDDCVMRSCGEANILSNITVNLIGRCASPDEASATMDGFCAYLHSLLCAKYGPPPANAGGNE